MKQLIAEKIFKKYTLEEINSFEEIKIGFTNKVYLINNSLILKICENTENEKRFEIEAFLYDFFKNKIPIPEVKVFDKTKFIYDKYFMICSKVEGVNLYSKWYLLDNKNRKNIIKQLCNILKTINNSSYTKFEKEFNKKLGTWHDKILKEIRHSLEILEKKKTLPKEFIKTINIFLENNCHVLIEERLGITHWDPHFDNIIIQNKQITGILDFEGIDISSIDLVLFTIKRMIDFPRDYISKEYKNYAKKEDYKNLLKWFQEFYPELFQFNNLDKRLEIYAIKHYLNDLIYFSESQVKERIAKIVKYDLTK